jgi:hypothetical protein
MKSVDQVSRGVASFFDEEIRHSLSGWKSVAYGVAVGRAAAGLPKMIEQYKSILVPLGIVSDGMIDVEGLASEIRSQMVKAGGTMTIELLGDKFTFAPADVDSLVRHIERA